MERGNHITDCLSPAIIHFSDNGSNIYKNTGTETTGFAVEHEQPLTKDKVIIYKKQQEVTRSFDVNHLRVRNENLAMKVKELQTELETLNETKLNGRRELNDIFDKRFGLKRENFKLRKQNTKMLNEQRQLTKEQLRLMKALEIQESELTAALKTNQNLRCVAKTYEVSNISFSDIHDRSS